MVRRQVVVLCIALGGCTFKASCNGRNKLDMDKVVTFVSGAIESYTGSKPSSVICPEQVEVAKGGAFVCTIEVAGLPGTVALTQPDGEASISLVSVTGIIASNKLEAEIQKQLTPADDTRKVDCGRRVHPSKPGGALTCDVKLGSDVVAHVAVTIKDDANNVSFKVVSRGLPEAEGSP